MADDRPAESEPEAIARLQRELEDMRSTVMMRVSRRPTGTIEMVVWATAPADTLFLQGQTVNRADYPGLWQVVQDRGGIAPGLFTVGNGSTTFGLPDFRGRVLRGASGEAPGALSGADTKAIATANLPAHDHDVTVPAHDNHDHDNSVGTLSNHSGHNSGTTTVASAIAGSQDFFFSVASTTQNGAGGHNHVVDVFPAGAASHTVTETPVGSGTAFDVRQASVAVHWLVYT